VTHPDETVAAGGIVRIINGCQVEDGVVKKIALPDRGLPILQAVEYLRGFLAGRLGWNAMQSLLIISGAFGVYRKETVIRAGGYSGKTDSEDLELVVRMRRMLREEKKKFRMAFVPDPVCWTEVPTTFGDLARQRARWHRGLIQTLWSERAMLFNPRYGRVGLIVMPYFLVFEMIGPFIETLGYVALVASYILGSLDREFLLLFLAVSVFYGAFLSVAAVLLEEVWFRRYPNWLDVLKLLLFSLVENLGYRQALSLFKIKAVWDLLLRHRGWGDITRIRFLPANGHGNSPR
jgi:cellulose synthase/poly-beta-1,6-N-acetylglucosamine synthase-like glycosyltransferase